MVADWAVVPHALRRRTAELPLEDGLSGSGTAAGAAAGVIGSIEPNLVSMALWPEVPQFGRASGPLLERSPLTFRVYGWRLSHDFGGTVAFQTDPQGY